MGISIVVPVYNKEKYISRILGDISNQSFEDFECIIVDDGSTDSSGEICDEFAAKDKRFCVQHVPNGGVSRARNIGLTRASGQYVTFIDADDHIEPDYLMQLYTDIERSRADMVIAGLEKFWEDGHPPVTIEVPRIGMCSMKDLMPDFARVQKQSGIYGFSCGKLLQRYLIEDTRFAEWLRLAEDFEFYLRIYPKINTIYFEDKCRYHYLQEALNSSTVVRDDNIDYLSQLKLNLSYRDFFIKSGWYDEENQTTVQRLLTDYAYFAVFHARREVVPSMLQTVHDIVVTENISTMSDNFMQRILLYYIKENAGIEAKYLLKLYDCARSIRRRCVRILKL